jgi:uncharacterized membrane protein YraQ (UPF0718 family)
VAEILRREFVYFWYYFSIQLQQLAPYWGLGMVLGSVISVFGKERIHRLLGAQDKRLGVLGLVPASLLGIASPLCMYGTAPLCASFASKGVEEDWIAAFMMSSILLNPQLLFYSAALGRTAVLIRLLSCFVCGVLAGLCVRCFFRKKAPLPAGRASGGSVPGEAGGFFRFSAFKEPVNRDTDPKIPLRLLKNMGRNIRATFPYFVAGLSLSALFQRYVPAETVAGLFGRNQGFGILLAATIGVPLYACGGGTIPLLMSWLNSGMSMGSAAAFMITGPATKITNLGALKIVLGLRNYGFYLLFTVIFALLSGFAVDLMIGAVPGLQPLGQLP